LRSAHSINGPVIAEDDVKEVTASLTRFLGINN